MKYAEIMRTGTALAFSMIMTVVGLCDAGLHAQNKPASEPPALQHISLWGLTMDKPLPGEQLVRRCPANGPKPIWPCLRSASELGLVTYDNTPVIHNLPYKDGKVELAIDENGVVAQLTSVIDEDHCEAVLQALGGKLGAVASHTTRQLQNAQGAGWRSDEWLWQAADGALVAYAQHNSGLTGCFLVAQSAAGVRHSQPPAVVQP